MKLADWPIFSLKLSNLSITNTGYFYSFLVFNIFAPMQDSFLATPIEYLKGVGPERAELLKKEARIFYLGQLLEYFPFRYIDKTQFLLIADLNEHLGSCQIKGQLIKVNEQGEKRKKRLTAILKDDTGSIELIWFKGIKWVKPKLHLGKDYIIYGKATSYNGKLNISHPDIELYDPSIQLKKGLQPIYHSTDKLSSKGLHSKGIEKIIKNLVQQIHQKIPETLPKSICEEFRLIAKEKALIEIHVPTTKENAQKAQFRLKFEELFFLQMQLVVQKLLLTKRIKGHVFSRVGDHFNNFYHNKLPFELTGAQKRVLREIRKDTATGQHMNRLVQGDVGSGKTMVALLSILIGLDNGFQAAFMAPTEILAKQHYASLMELLGEGDLHIDLLTGSSKTKHRKTIHSTLASGQLNILIGTHALLEDIVVFKNLGLVVIDEQHRFGVAQRARLWKKNRIPPHILVMTATPIPRTLAMTLYGDLDVSVIDELPPGRKPVQTMHKYDANRLRIFQFMEDQIAEGRQVYVVYPLIEESETLDYKDLMDGYDSITRRFPLPDYRVSIVHGRMKAEDKEHEMQLFVKGKTQIMVATTVIEVGVNVPNASVMVIESAEKFGLSQLHQLRGRVGRGAKQSFCVLMTSHKLSADGRKRIETMVRTNDGFEIAEVDLNLRGPGDIMGTQQSGLLDLKIADLAKDNLILSTARDAAMKLLENDPDFKNPENKVMYQHLKALMKNRTTWSRIS